MDMTRFTGSDYMTAGDIPQGESKNLLIDRVELVDGFGDDKNETKPVVHFQDHDRALVVNKTNCGTLISLLGPNSDAWRNRAITLRVIKTNMGPGLSVVPQLPDLYPPQGQSNYQQPPPPSTEQMIRQAPHNYGQQPPPPGPPAAAGQMSEPVATRMPQQRPNPNQNPDDIPF